MNNNIDDDIWNVIARKKLNLSSYWEWRRATWLDNGDLSLQMREMPDGFDYVPIIITAAELKEYNDQ